MSVKRTDVYVCPTEAHSFSVIDSNYFKKRAGAIAGRGSFDDVYDVTISYTRILCSKCGETREIVAREQRQEEGPRRG